MTFNSTSRHMELYSVLASSLFVSDTAALIQLAPRAGAEWAVPLLQARHDAAAAAINAHLWDETTGVHTNKLFNGSFYRRYSPTSFYPLLAGVSSAEQAASAISGFLTSPDHFCVTDSHRGPKGSSALIHYRSEVTNTSVFVATDEGLDEALTIGTFDFVRPEALLWSPTAPLNVTAPLVALRQWRNAATKAFAVSADADPPAAGYELVRVEGMCAAKPAGDASLPLNLWVGRPKSPHGVPPLDFLLCGTADCEHDAQARGYTLNSTHLCYALSAVGPRRLPCRYGIPPSISRSDPIFGYGAGEYWAGRIWAPHAALVYWGLRNYDHVGVAGAARRTLVSEARMLFLRDWRSLRHINENSNAVTGTGTDNESSDAFYHWGALTAYLSLEEELLSASASSSVPVPVPAS